MRYRVWRLGGRVDDRVISGAVHDQADAVEYIKRNPHRKCEIIDSRHRRAGTEQSMVECFRNQQTFVFEKYQQCEVQPDTDRKREAAPRRLYSDGTETGQSCHQGRETDKENLASCRKPENDKARAD